MSIKYILVKTCLNSIISGNGLSKVLPKERDAAESLAEKLGARIVICKNGVGLPWVLQFSRKGNFMTFFLQIIGGSVLAVLVLIAGIYLYFKLKFGKYLGLDNQPVPLVVHLTEDILPDWAENPNAKKIIDELKELGFEQGKAYEINEMRDISLISFFNTPVTAVINWHKAMGIFWVDMVTDIKGGTEYTFSNAPMGSGIDMRPECKKKFDQTATTRALYEEIRNIISDVNEKFEEIDDDSFREYFETQYKKDMAWTNRKGGLTLKEYLKTETEAPFSVTDKVKEESFIELKYQELIQWEHAAIMEFFRSEGIPEENYYEHENQYLIVPFTTHLPAFLQYLEQSELVTERQSEKLLKTYPGETDMFALFEKINALNSPDFRATFVKELDFPLSLKIYQISEEMNTGNSYS